MVFDEIIQSSLEAKRAAFNHDFDLMRQIVFGAGKRSVFDPKDPTSKPEEFPDFGIRAKELWGERDMFEKHLPYYDSHIHNSYTGWVENYSVAPVRHGNTRFEYAYLANGNAIYTERMTNSIDFINSQISQTFYQTTWIGEGIHERKKVTEWYYEQEEDHYVLVRTTKKG